YDTIKTGEGSRHVVGYLCDFLFTPDRARTPIKSLSGGERNRLLLAKLFAKPANVIILDEPTNDLDSETLDLLEERLIEFEGTLLIVSHDRAFLNNVVTNTLVFEPDGVRDYVGGYDDWIRQRDAAAKAQQPAAKPKSAGIPAPSKAPPVKKLAYKEKRELESLPKTIEQLEAKLSELHAKMAEPAFYQGPPADLA
ncbi:unnamed protein product, partial [Ectocarpus sp. 4 AP-2014]